jgi:hypothetical protein
MKILNVKKVLTVKWENLQSREKMENSVILKIFFGFRVTVGRFFWKFK